MILYPNAKVNLGLRITEKRSDGFHNIESLFLPIGLTDILEFVPAYGKVSSIEITGIELDSDPKDNLVMRAWKLMHDRHKVPPLDIHLHKIIPVGAGLGGGSADAAFMLRGIDKYFSLGCSMDELEGYAAELGSDCAFFIQNRPALGTGRGELLEVVDFSLPEYEILLVNPAIHISSKEAYSGVTPKMPADRLTELLKQDILNWQDSVRNDFETSIFVHHPQIKALKERLLDMGAHYSSMSGSGSSVYGFFPKGMLDGMELEFGEWFTFVGSAVNV